MHATTKALRDEASRLRARARTGYASASDLARLAELEGQIEGTSGGETGTEEEDQRTRPLPLVEPVIVEMPKPSEDRYAHTKLPRSRTYEAPPIARSERPQYVTIRVTVAVHLALKARSQEAGQTMIGWLGRAVGLYK